ncbi:unnamed protein product [Bodo saltans]|uniref:Uncharacterized protein n=1 Tax=Bodo saltans TaxID=75058 RepID=A0A0S4JG85_BODSA|nr:unnamed protein product [Bodo saltans]|eukprot:CUG88217.1 unnamed protein product [Bodo saltans]
MSRSGTPRLLGGRYTPSVGMTDDELALELQRLDQENATLEDQVAKAMSAQKTLVAKVVHMQQVTETEEEAIANNLLKKVDQVKKEMRSNRQQIKAEEEYHKKLKAQIDQVRQEQEQMENMLEQEQEFVLHKLQRELLETSLRKSEIEKSLAEERRQYLELLHTQLSELSMHPSSSGGGGGSPSATHVSPSIALNSHATTTGRPVGGAGAVHARTSSDAITAASEISASFSDAVPSNVTSDVHMAPASLTGSVAASPSFATAGGWSMTPQRTATRTPEVRRRTIADLELEINHLLLEQSDYQRKAQAQEQQCTDLLNKLHDIQQGTFLDKARMVRLQEDLVRARTELENVQQMRPSSSSSLLLHRATPSSSDEPSTGTTPLHHQSLRDRTKEVLSTPRIDMNAMSIDGGRDGRPGARVRGSSVASDHRSVSPSLTSGYNSGVESQRGGDSSTFSGVPRLRGSSRVGDLRHHGRLFQSVPMVPIPTNAHGPVVHRQPQGQQGSSGQQLSASGVESASDSVTSPL